MSSKDTPPLEGLRESLAGNLSTNLRAIRDRRSLTQAQLARLCQVPRSTIASIETGDSNPTLSVLARVATALQVSIEELLTKPRVACRVFREGELPIRTHGRGERKVTVHKLLPHPIPGMEIDRVELEPGARMVGTPHRPGTHEYLTCERGRLVLTVAAEKFELGRGDVAAFPGDQPHGYHNPGSSRAVGFSVVSLAPVLA